MLNTAKFLSFFLLLSGVCVAASQPFSSDEVYIYIYNMCVFVCV